MEQYSLLINTDKYAGNFERELTAFCTGVNGECEVGDTSLYDEEYDFGDILEQVPDEHGCHRPCEVYFLNGHSNTVRIYFQDNPSVDEMSIIKRRAKTYCENKSIIIISFSLLVTKTEEILIDLHN